jgi:hypothetical protein
MAAPAGNTGAGSAWRCSTGALSTPLSRRVWTREERAVALSEFQQEIQSRMQTARQSLEQARLEGDDYLIQVRLGEIESLERLAAEYEDETLAS